MPETFDITETVSAKRHVVMPHGELDFATVPALDARLRALLEADAEIIVDLSALSFLDCRGVAALISAVQAAARQGARLEVRGPPPPVFRVLELCGVAQQLGVSPP